jgi:esterase/lipase superfamily enzyme
MAIGASFGAYHAVDIALRFPDVFNRAIGMSGIYDIRSVKNWNNGSDDWAIWQSNPCEYIRWLDDGNALDKIRQLDLIIPVGHDDPNFGNNQYFSDLLWQRGIWHAFRVWDGNAHDWPCWQEMVLHYIGGAETKG